MSLFSKTLILILFSCSTHNPSDVQENLGGNKSEVIKHKTISKHSIPGIEEQENIEDEYFDYSNTTLKFSINDSARFKFSNSNSPDLFTFYVPNGNINDTKSTLKVVDERKNVVFELKFQTRELVNGYALSEIKNEQEMVKYILKQAHGVLTKSSFMDFNNLDKESYLNEVPAEDFQHYDVLEMIKLEKRYVFVLNRDEENTIYFGYDKNSKKVVEIYTCC